MPQSEVRELLKCAFNNNTRVTCLFVPRSFFFILSLISGSICHCPVSSRISSIHITTPKFLRRIK